MLPPIDNYKQEASTSFSIPSPGSKSKFENQPIFDTIKDQLYLKINQHSYLVGLLKKIKSFKKAKIDYNKLQKFSSKNIKIILNNLDIINMIFNFIKISKTTIMYEEKSCCAEEINDIEQYNEELSTLGNNECYSNFIKIDDEEVKEETKENYETKNEIIKKEIITNKIIKNEIKSEETTIGIKNTEKDQLKNSINEFLNKTKFLYVNDLEGPLICDIELLNLDKNLKFFSDNNNYFKDLISPKNINNDLYIPLPEWAQSINSFNLNCKLYIILGILLLLYYSYYYIKGKIYKNNELSQILAKYEEKIKKINNCKAYLKSYCPMIIYNCFSSGVLKDIFKFSTVSYLKNNNNNYKENIENIKEIFENTIQKLKNEIHNCQDNNKKIEKLFEYITFYTFDDILNSRHFIYLSFLNYLLDYIQNDLIPGSISLKIIDIYNIIEDLKKKWYPKRIIYINEIITLIIDILKYDYAIKNIICYGSNATGLDIIGSDIDLIIYYKEIEKSNGNLLEDLNKKLSNLNISDLEIKFLGKASVPIIKLKYNIYNRLLNYNDFCWINSILYAEKQYKFLEIEDFIEIKIDISCTTDDNYFANIQKMTKMITDEIKDNKIIKPVIIYLKILLKIGNMNSVHEGWLSSLSIVIMTINTVKTYIKENNEDEINPYKIMHSFLKRFSNYNFDYEIDINGYNKPCIQPNNDDEKRFMIINPINNDIISEKSYHIKEIKHSFEKLLYSLQNFPF